jgi:hypothetical protein
MHKPYGRLCDRVRSRTLALSSQPAYNASQSAVLLTCFPRWKAFSSRFGQAPTAVEKLEAVMALAEVLAEVDTGLSTRPACPPCPLASRTVNVVQP